MYIAAVEVVRGNTPRRRISDYLERYPNETKAQLLKFTENGRVSLDEILRVDELLGQYMCSFGSEPIRVSIQKTASAAVNSGLATYANPTVKCHMHAYLALNPAGTESVLLGVHSALGELRIESAYAIGEAGWGSALDAIALQMGLSSSWADNDVGLITCGDKWFFPPFLSSDDYFVVDAAGALVLTTTVPNLPRHKTRLIATGLVSKSSNATDLRNSIEHHLKRFDCDVKGVVGLVRMSDKIAVSLFEEACISLHVACANLAHHGVAMPMVLLSEAIQQPSIERSQILLLAGTTTAGVRWIAVHQFLEA
jgi:hypothetical protein